MWTVSWLWTETWTMSSPHVPHPGGQRVRCSGCWCGQHKHWVYQPLWENDQKTSICWIFFQSHQWSGRVLWLWAETRSVSQQHVSQRTPQRATDHTTWCTSWCSGTSHYLWCKTQATLLSTKLRLFKAQYLLAGLKS